MEVPLPLVLIDNSRLFYQVTDDVPSYGDALENRTKGCGDTATTKPPPTAVSRGTEMLKVSDVGPSTLLGTVPFSFLGSV